jgi:Phage ABA sandwich domain
LLGFTGDLQAMSDVSNERILDAEVAEKVMGFRREKTPKDCDGNFGGEDILVPRDIDHNRWSYPPKGQLAFTFWVPKFSTDLEKAWEVFEKFHSRYLFFNPDLVKGWECKLSNEKDTRQDVGTPYAYGETAPIAICLAALEGVKNK